MKKNLLVLALSLCSILGYSQTDSQKTDSQKTNGKNEVKLNLPYYLFGMPEVTYERILDESSALGISAEYTLENADDMPLRWTIVPYYRMYFGGQKSKTRATGFFIEGSATVASQIIKYDQYANDTYASYDKRSTNVGYGVAIGVKLLNKNGYMADLFGGVSRVFGVDNNAYDYQEFYPRVGISIGRRF